MLTKLWVSWGISMVGPLHIKTGVQNQDCCMIRTFPWGTVIAVSDGLGSKPNARLGSKAACRAVIAAARQKYAAPALELPQLIHTQWLKLIEPFSPRSCSATCLFAVQTSGSIITGMIGDGMIAVCKKTGFQSFVLTDHKEQSFSNYTYSLQETFIPQYWKTETVDVSECTAVVLCTDGISDDLLPEKRLLFAEELYGTYASLEAKERNRSIKMWLRNWPVPNHTDDKTIACLFKRDGIYE